FVEYIFGYNGLGKTTVDALETSDFPVITGSVLFIAFIFVMINLLVDFLYVLIDPRVKLE
ncbi:MAG: ABC transporter permease subunit, partial [Sphingobacteriaceae bacterium]